jgi:hypothetical protein
MLKDPFSSAAVERVGRKIEMVGISSVALDGQAVSTLARRLEHGFAVIHADTRPVGPTSSAKLPRPRVSRQEPRDRAGCSST